MARYGCGRVVVDAAVLGALFYAPGPAPVAADRFRRRPPLAPGPPPKTGFRLRPRVR
ncbi:hypothetical protein GCM10010371_51420 [Streptomyces subrutilus]|uniref:Uncharacterized protein n=1 Tax=Streptomyces subrutilus TaxID=36818 RepID=A0A918R4Q7_9ACTN|nr:hypothetical protein GCM10010371_51420 [Streptomyces subrutilus]